MRIGISPILRLKNQYQAHPSELHCEQSPMIPPIWLIPGIEPVELCEVRQLIASPTSLALQLTESSALPTGEQKQRQTKALILEHSARSTTLRPRKTKGLELTETLDWPQHQVHMLKGLESSKCISSSHGVNLRYHNLLLRHRILQLQPTEQQPSQLRDYFYYLSPFSGSRAIIEITRPKLIDKAVESHMWLRFVLQWDRLM